MRNWKKSLGAVVATIASALVAALSGDNALSSPEILNIVVIALAAVSATVIPELDAGIAQFAKPIVLASSAAATLAVNLIADGITTGEWLQLLVAALGAVGIAPLSGPKFRLDSRVDT